MDFEDDIKIEPYEGESKAKKTIKKLMVISIGVFLILLIISYLVVSPRVLNIFEGLLESSTIDNNTIILNENSSVIFTQGI
ncbi:hypothetical protein K8R47_03050, partial [archaeon]|nr:hypothetical protein [archaeon]